MIGGPSGRFGDEARRRLAERTAAQSRVEEWSARIHDKKSQRYAWTIAVAEALLDGGEIPEPVGRWMPGAAEGRIDTIRRLIEGSAS